LEETYFDEDDDKAAIDELAKSVASGKILNTT
jgi:hypothetical protein